MRKFILLACILAIMGCFTGCAKTKCNFDIPVPPDPILLPVEVINGMISGPALDNLIENHMRLWEYIELLKKKGFSEKAVKSAVKKYLKMVPELRAQGYDIRTAQDLIAYVKSENVKL